MGPALKSPYEELSCLVTRKIYRAQEELDMPPPEHDDALRWLWGSHFELPDKDSSPMALTDCYLSSI